MWNCICMSTYEPNYKGAILSLSSPIAKETPEKPSQTRVRQSDSEDNSSISNVIKGRESWGFAFFSEIGKFNSHKIYSKNPSYKTLSSYVIWTFLHISLKNNLFHVDFFICVISEFPVILADLVSVQMILFFYYVKCVWSNKCRFHSKTAIFDSENQFLSFETFQIAIAKMSSLENFWH